MSNFQAEHPETVITLTATATLAAGDPVTGAGAKATNATNFIGVAMADAVSGEAVPVMVAGVASVQIDSGSSGITAGGRVTYASDGYDAAGAANGFAFALDSGAASGYIRILLAHASAA